MRWLFWPPHLTLKPSKKNTKKHTPLQKKQKRAFQLSVKIFFLLWWVSKISLVLTTWRKKRSPKKHHRNRGFQQVFFGKQMCVTKRPFLDQKNPKPEIPVLLFLPFSSFSTTKTTTICRNPYFYSVLANLQKENFQILNIKHRNIKKKKTIFAPFFFEERAIFRQLANNWTQKTHTHTHKMITEQKRSLETPIFIMRK